MMTGNKRLWSSVLAAILLFVLFTVLLPRQGGFVAGAEDVDVEEPTKGGPAADESGKAKEPSKTAAKGAAEVADVIEDARIGVHMDKLSEQEMEVMKSESEPHEFQAEVYRLMDIIINSLYTHKEVFLRELISNSADALEKMRFMSLEDPSSLGNASDLRIVVDFDFEERTLSVTDTGIGMTKLELINNLGTVAKSGTSNFLEALAAGNDVNLIGQFGVGFYSAFLVADKVVVTSKHSDDSQHIWTSTADASFTVAKDPRGNTLGRGTRVTLHLKNDAYQFCTQKELVTILTKYSQFVNFPLYLRVEEKVKVEVPEEEDEAKKDEDNDDLEVEEGEEPKKLKKPKTEEKLVWKLKHMNKQRPIWLRPKEELTDEDYHQFYRSLIKDDMAVAPLSTIHFSAEGEIEFKALLFVPGAVVGDPYQGFFGKKQDVKLYVRRVLVAEQFDDIVPNWMTFLKGVIDSDDLPLKVDRESVSQGKTLKVITRRITRKVLEVLRKIMTKSDKADDEMADMTKVAEEEGRKLENDTIPWTDEELTKFKKLNETSMEYKNFWKVFGKNVRLGCMDDDGSSRGKIAKLLRYYTSKSLTEPISIQVVSDRAPEWQGKKIYYMNGEDPVKMMESPLIQGFLKKDVEVILLVDAVDEPCLGQLQHFDAKLFKSIEKSDFEISTVDERNYHVTLGAVYDPFTKWWKKYVTKQTKVPGKFGSRVTAVNLSLRLTKDAVAIAAPEYGITGFNEKVYRYQTFADEDKTHYQRINRILEINPEHPIIREMLRLFNTEGENSEKLHEYADTLLETALISSGYNVENSPAVAEMLHRAIARDMNVDTSFPYETIDLSSYNVEPSPPPTDAAADDVDAMNDVPGGDEEEAAVEKETGETKEKGETAKAETSKAETAKAETAKAETAKAEATKGESKKGETSKAETAKAEATKGESKKGETAKAETAKGESKKGGAAKGSEKAASDKETVTKKEKKSKEAKKQEASDKDEL